MSKLRHFLHPIYRRLETNVHPLRYLFVEITQRCNLRCRHCGSDCTRDTQFDELSTDEWLDFFAYLNRRVNTRKVLLIVTGGEPSCHPEFDRILDGLRRNDLAWGMVTNGFSLSPDNVRKIVEHGVSTMTVSVDGLEASHDWLRGRKGSFRRAVAGLEQLVAARLPFLDVVTCVHPRILDELPQVRRLLMDIGVPAWRLFSIFPKGRARENRELLLDADGFRHMLDFIRASRTELKGSGFVTQFSCEGYLPEELDKQVRDEPYFCRAGISIGSVLCDGSISACPNISRELIQGNIRDDDFVDVWENRFQAYRDRAWMQEGPCVDCQHWKRCKGNSMHLWDDQVGHTGLCTFDLLGLTKSCES